MSIMMFINCSPSTWLSSDTFLDNLNFMTYINLKIHNMIMCNTLTCMWMNDIIRTHENYLIIEKAHDKYRFWLWHDFYECKCVCGICTYLCVFYMRKGPCGSWWWGKMGYFVYYICWHVNTCWRKDCAGAVGGGRRIIMLIYI